MESLFNLRDVAWAWVGLPALIVSAVVVSVLLRFPQATRLGEAFRAVNAHDPKAEGSLPPATALALSTAASIGAGAVVSAATAMGLGGPGALVWLWGFGLLIAPLRLAEALLARTAPPGKAGKKSREDGSLAARLVADSDARIAGLGNLLFLLTPITVVAIVGGLHGTALVGAADYVLPGSAETIGFAVAAAAALFAFFGRDKAWLGWTTLAALVVLLAVCVISIAYDPADAFSTLASSFSDAFEGAPAMRSFSGALAGEVAGAAIGAMLPVIAAPSGIDGSLASLAQPRTVKAQAAAAMLPVLAHVLIGTLVIMAIGGTNAYARPVDTSRSLAIVGFYDSAFETVSQRMESERQWRGFIRVIDGTAQATPLQIGSERGMIEDPHFVEADGSPGNFAIRIEDARVTRILRPDEDGALRDVPVAQVAGIQVTGRMLPMSGALFAAAVTRGGGELAGRAALAALMLLAALGAAAMGLALARMFRKRVTENGAHAMSALPAIGLVLGATSFGPTLGTIAAIAAALTTLLVAIAVVAKARELAK